VFIHHKDYRDVAQYVWPVERPKSYLIGRYMFEVDKIHTQWAEQIRWGQASSALPLAIASEPYMHLQHFIGWPLASTAMLHIR
jgi:hypothetical protein